MYPLSKKTIGHIAIVMICFFMLGAMDLVTTSFGMAQKELGLTDAALNDVKLATILSFIGGALISGIAACKFGRTIMITAGLSISMIALFLPMDNIETSSINTYSMVMIGLGMGITTASIFPLVANLVGSNRNPSIISLGFFVKTLSILLGIFLIQEFSDINVFTFGMGWRMVFPIMAIVALVAIMFINLSGIEKNQLENGKQNKVSDFSVVLKSSFAWLSSLTATCSLGIDISLCAITPMILSLKFPALVEDATFYIVLYLVFRGIGCIIGAIAMQRMNPRMIFQASVICMAIAGVALFFANTELTICICISLIALSNANVFSIVTSQALSYFRRNQNAISTILSIVTCSSIIFPTIMTSIADTFGYMGIYSFILLAISVLGFFVFGVKKEHAVSVASYSSIKEVVTVAENKN